MLTKIKCYTHSQFQPQILCTRIFPEVLRKCQHVTSPVWAMPVSVGIAAAEPVLLILRWRHSLCKRTLWSSRISYRCLRWWEKFNWEGLNTCCGVNDFSFAFCRKKKSLQRLCKGRSRAVTITQFRKLESCWKRDLIPLKN